MDHCFITTNSIHKEGDILQIYFCVIFRETRHHAQAHVTSGALRASAHERLEPQRGFFFTVAMKSFVLNVRERTDGCFTAAFFQTHLASISVRCGGRTAVGGGNGTRVKITLRARAAKQPHGHQCSSAVPSKCTHHESRHQDF